MSTADRSWQELCEAASTETDSEQLMILVSELMKALDERTLGMRGCGEAYPGA